MGSVTPVRSYPFPQSSDLIAQGAVNIEDLAESLEASLALPMNALDASANGTAYPPGMSVMRINSDSLGWPYKYGIVHTLVAVDAIAWQWFYQYSASKVYLRQAINPEGWKDWFPVLAPGRPEAQASGSATVPVTGGSVSSVTVTFPSGRFEYAPAVFTQYRGGSPGVSTSPSSVTNTSFVLNVMRDTSTDAYVYWQAVSNQGE